jgi:hypothetical protein
LEEGMMEMDDETKTMPTGKECVKDEMMNTNEEKPTTPWATQG